MKNIYLIIGIIILALGALLYFMTSSEEEAVTNTEAVVETSVVNEEVATPATNEVTIVMSTSMGDITFELNAVDAPNTVANFVKLANDGFYDGTKFHRIIQNFMIQGGDPLTKDDTLMSSWGTGGPGYAFADEIHANNNNDVGTISMANSGPNTNGSQFFINMAPNNFLDDKHTVFGKVVDGLDVATAIIAVQTEGPDRPVEPVIINSISVK